MSTVNTDTSLVPTSLISLLYDCPPVFVVEGRVEMFRLTKSRSKKKEGLWGRRDSREGPVGDENRRKGVRVPHRLFPLDI